MFIPKVKFKSPTVNREAEMLVYFCRPRKTGWDWSDVIYRNHPELEKMLKGKKSNKFYDSTYKYADDFIKKNKKELNIKVKKYQKEWDKINDRYLKILCKHFETTCPKDIKNMTAYVSIIPIFPRFLDEWGFNVSFQNPKSMTPISMHEILHFLYFKKWMEVFPKTKRKELDSPYLAWRLSEILCPIILNNHKDIQKLFKHKHGHYSEFQKINIGEKTMIGHFEDLYKEHLSKQQSFEEFLKICWSEALRHKKIIEKI